MTISEIKNLAKFLTDEEAEKIKQEIKDKENVLKIQNMDEEEIGQVLNTLFAILVIEKTLELEIDGVEEIRADLEKELLEAYEIYDAYMIKYKKEEKKKKKNWLLNFLLLSDKVHSKKEGIGASNKAITELKKELNELRKQTSNENLTKVMKDLNSPIFKEFCALPDLCDNPFHCHRHPDIEEIRERRRIDKYVDDVMNRKIDRASALKVRESNRTNNDNRKVEFSTMTLDVSDGGQDQRKDDKRSSSKKL